MAHLSVKFVIAGGACSHGAALVGGGSRGRCGGVQSGSGCRRRRIGQGAGDTRGFFGAVAVFAGDFGTRLGAFACGVIVFRGDLGLAEVDVQVYLRAHIGIAHDRHQNF